MKQVLHIVTRPDDTLASEIIARQTKKPDLRLTVIDLTTPNPDYEALLESIFMAGSIAVW